MALSKKELHFINYTKNQEHGEKKCRYCKETMLYTKFHKNIFNLDGHQRDCIECRKKATKDKKESDKLKENPIVVIEKLTQKIQNFELMANETSSEAVIKKLTQKIQDLELVANEIKFSDKLAQKIKVIKSEENDGDTKYFLNEDQYKDVTDLIKKNEYLEQEIKALRSAANLTEKGIMYNIDETEYRNIQKLIKKSDVYNEDKGFLLEVIDGLKLAIIERDNIISVQHNIISKNE